MVENNLGQDSVKTLMDVAAVESIAEYLPNYRAQELSECTDSIALRNSRELDLSDPFCGLIVCGILHFVERWVSACQVILSLIFAPRSCVHVTTLGSFHIMKSPQ